MQEFTQFLQLLLTLILLFYLLIFILQQIWFVIKMKEHYFLSPFILSLQFPIITLIQAIRTISLILSLLQFLLSFLVLLPPFAFHLILQLSLISDLIQLVFWIFLSSLSQIVNLIFIFPLISQLLQINFLKLSILLAFSLKVFIKTKDLIYSLIGFISSSKMSLSYS